MKYMGSKARIAPYISEIINNIALCEHITDYYEPFMGGCSVGELINIENRYLSDISEPIVALFQKAQQGMWNFKHISKEEYELAKSDIGKYNHFEPWEIGWIALGCSFRGKLFQGYASEFVDSKSNTKRNIQQETYNQLSKERALLSGIQFKHCSYDEIGEPYHSIIYCDAPYRNTTKYIFAKDFDFNKYDNWLISKAKNNLVLISEYSMLGNFSSNFEILDNWNLSSNIGSGSTDTNESIESLFYVKGGWLTDKYFNTEDTFDF